MGDSMKVVRDTPGHPKAQQELAPSCLPSDSYLIVSQSSRLPRVTALTSWTFRICRPITKPKYEPTTSRTPRLSIGSRHRCSGGACCWLRGTSTLPRSTTSRNVLWTAIISCVHVCKADAVLEPKTSRITTSSFTWSTSLFKAPLSMSHWHTDR